MSKMLRKPILPLSLLLIVALGGFFINSTCSFASDKRPNRDSVQFGAQEKPNIEVPPAMEAFSTVFADISEQVVPTVVSVIPTKIDTVVFSNNPFYQFFGDQFFGGSPFQDFFGPPRSRRQQPQMQKREQRRQGMGSGVIVSKDGYILTNYHVVSGADEIEVKTSDNRSFEAKIIGSDSLTDVAVIKITNKVNDLPIAYLGDSDKLRPGDWSIAVGNPFSLTSSVTMGIISAIGRTTPSPGSGTTYQNFIQTDAAINPGNSGGALVNIRGELIGINTMIYTRSGGNMGIGFAIPINMARRIMEDLIYEGRVTRGWLGVMIQELDYSTREALGLSTEVRGVLIGDVFDGQPADKAGIVRGDIITSIDGKVVENPNQLRNAVAAVRPGNKIPVELIRNSEKKTVTATLVERDEDVVQRGGRQEQPKDGDDSSEEVSRTLGMELGNLTRELRQELNLGRNINGVVVLSVDQNSQVAQEGLREMDVILEVNRRSVRSVEEFNKAAEGSTSGNPILFLVLRDNSTFFRAFRVR